MGHVFKLGTKYSEALAARFLDEKEQLGPIIMGCYGIGVNRIIAALIETSHDENGILWPLSLAPYEVLLAPVKVTDPATQQATDALYAALEAAGVEVLLDDRDVRAGVKFKDADLVGIPLRVVLGERGLKDGKLEIKWRWDKQAELIDLATAAETIAGLIRRGARRRPPLPQPPGEIAGIIRRVPRLCQPCGSRLQHCTARLTRPWHPSPRGGSPESPVEIEPDHRDQAPPQLELLIPRPADALVVGPQELRRQT